MKVYKVRFGTRWLAKSRLVDDENEASVYQYVKNAKLQVSLRSKELLARLLKQDPMQYNLALTHSEIVAYDLVPDQDSSLKCIPEEDRFGKISLKYQKTKPKGKQNRKKK